MKRLTMTCGLCILLVLALAAAGCSTASGGFNLSNVSAPDGDTPTVTGTGTSPTVTNTETQPTVTVTWTWTSVTPTTRKTTTPKEPEPLFPLVTPIPPGCHWVSLCGGCDHHCTKVVRETKAIDQNGAVLYGPDYRTWTEDIGWDPTMEDVQAAGNAKSCESIGGSYSSSDEMVTVHAGTFPTRSCTIHSQIHWFYKNLVEIKFQTNYPDGTPYQVQELYSYE
jgi:hypothetical protein